MRFLLVISLLPSIALSQEPPVHVQLRSDKVSEHRYQLEFSFTVAKGWHIYATSDAELSLDGLTITPDNEGCSLFDEGPDTSAVSKIADPVFDNRLLAVYQKNFTIRKELLFKDKGTPLTNFWVKGFASNNKEFLPIAISLKLNASITHYRDQFLEKIPTIDTRSPSSDCGGSITVSSKSLFTIFLLGFGGGILALLTPCVFPMIPVTVSYFTGKAKSRGAAMRQGAWYGGSILLIYLAASLPFHLVGNLDPLIFNTIATNAWVNLFFFAVFILFALSLFGLFEINLPSSVTNLAGSKGKIATAAGTFFMAFTLVVVSFSCTGPVLGSLIVGSIHSEGGALALSFGMAGFGLALGLPFTLFAMFPRLLQSLPKSGSWMNVVKKSLAFVELALAVKFLSNADMVEHWGFLKRETFVVTWIGIFLTLALYLLGAFRKRRQIQASPVLRVAAVVPRTSFSAGRYLFGILSLLFSLYLLAGITHIASVNLKLLSGFAPPVSYSIYGEEKLKAKDLMPDVVNDFSKALRLARKERKPLLVDFTGWACVNCRRMEENVWSDHSIESMIKEKFILVSLYVDDRKKLPASERTVYRDPEGEVRKIYTIGDKYAFFQAVNFNQVTQPLYAIVSPEGKLMNHPVGYTPAVDQYLQWLECGYRAFESRNGSD